MNTEFSKEIENRANQSSAQLPRAFARIKAGRVPLGGPDESSDERKSSKAQARADIRSAPKRSRPAGSSEWPKEE